jgi:outer membrane protein OmpA-like peptidoglycan-associated protein
MKKVSKILIVATAIIFANMATQPLQAQPQFLPKQEFTINAFGGLSTLLYSVEDINQQKVERKNGFGFGGGFGYHYFFNDQLGLVTGLDIALYKASVSESFIQFNEDQTLWMLQAPIMLQYLAPLEPSASKHFYAGLGVRLGYAVSGKYSQTVDAPPAHSNSLKFSAFNVMLSADLGIRWKIGESMALYTGIYADYGLLNIIPAKSEHALLRSEVSILEARIGVDNAERYTSKVNTFAAGLKIKLAFGGKKKPAPVQEPEFVPAPKPKPVPAPEPIKEIPQEIKQTMIRLSNTLFEFDKFNLTSEAVAELNKVVKWLNDNPNLRVEIEGHTDSMGSAAYNQKLSEDRAKSVYNYFIEHGVKSSRLSYRGYGLTRPIADNSTADGRQQNRRVELQIMQ